MSRHTTRPRSLSSLLEELHEQRCTGTVLVSGSPGGRVHLRSGRICAADTPGSPGPETVLRNTGRLGDEEWDAACAAATPGEPFAAVLEGCGLLGRQEFDIVCTATMFDAAFALAISTLESWEITDAVPVPWLGPTFSPRRVTTDTKHRLTVLEYMWGGPVADLAQLAVRPAPDLPSRVPERYATLLRAANGRRTPRDIAFALGRGTYAVMLDIARMNGLGLLHHDRPAARGGRPSTAPRTAEPRPSADSTPEAAAAQLPRRTPGAQHPHLTARR
ncbi:hypothetical protein ACWC4D_23400 [Streptomyces sp. NPDC001288]|uniref:hypothetical protein n=1 Tax=Streptomyces sp. NPDC001297 TaxID=3364559 RepID=UPI00367503C8